MPGTPDSECEVGHRNQAYPPLSRQKTLVPKLQLGNGVKVYLAGLHVMKNSPHHQMDAHHFCRQVNQDLAQCTSYGKTWHVWNTGHHGVKGDPLPYGPPELAWSFNRDPEALPGLLEQYAKEMKVDVAEKRKQRAELVQLAHPQEGVDALQKQFPRAGHYPQGVIPKKAATSSGF